MGKERVFYRAPTTGRDVHVDGWTGFSQEALMEGNPVVPTVSFEFLPSTGLMSASIRRMRCLEARCSAQPFPLGLFLVTSDLPTVVQDPLCNFNCNGRGVACGTAIGGKSTKQRTHFALHRSILQCPKRAFQLLDSATTQGSKSVRLGAALLPTPR